MQVKIKRLSPTTELPAYHTPGSAAFDLCASVEVTIPPKSLALIPTGLIIATPPGYMLVVVPRSSTPKRKGLLIPHGIGIIDSDYAGEGDEIKLQVYNFTDEPVVVVPGERISQAAFIKVERAEWQEVRAMDTPDRGGFGSTG